MTKHTPFITRAFSGLGYTGTEHVLQKGEPVVMGVRTVELSKSPTN
jgi:hypothetical protein